MLEPKLPAVADRLRQAREEITAFADFPDAHWRKVWSTNPVERSNREIKRAPTSSGSSPTPLHGTGFHPASCVLIRAQDEWQVSDRRYLSEGFMAMLAPPEPTTLQTRSDQRV